MLYCCQKRRAHCRPVAGDSKHLNSEAIAHWAFTAVNNFSETICIFSKRLYCHHNMVQSVDGDTMT